MARPLRVEFEGAVYHLSARGNARQPVFRDERDCARFLELLTESAQRFEAAILCFVLMGNHFHLVAQTRRPNLRRWMHWLLVSYTMYFNRRHRSSGHLFQGAISEFFGTRRRLPAWLESLRASQSGARAALGTGKSHRTAKTFARL